MIAHSPASTWRDPILAQFTPDIATVARLTVVADPDELLTEQGVIDGIRQRGFEIVPFEDHVAFRYAYERRFREVWDNGKDTNLVVVLRATRSDISGLPFDLLEQAKRDRRLLSFSLAELFPSLAPHVLSELDRGDLDAVSAAQQLFKPEPLGENATRDFLLRHVFRLDPAQIQDDAELLRALLRRHYSGKIIPKSLDDRLIHLLRSTDRWQEWPLDQIVPSRCKFPGVFAGKVADIRASAPSLAGKRTARGSRPPTIFSSPVPWIFRSTTTTFVSTSITCLPMVCWLRLAASLIRLSPGLGWLSAWRGLQARTRLHASENSCSFCSLIARR